MTLRPLTDHHLEFLSSSESIFVKMPHCWKSHVAAHIWSTVNVLNFKLFSLSIFSIKMVIKAEVHKMLVKIANRKEPVKTASSNAV